MTSAAAEIRQPRRRRRLGPRTRAFFAAPSGIFAVVILALLAFFAAFGPMLFEDQATTLDFTQTRQGPSWDHLLGTAFDAPGYRLRQRDLGIGSQPDYPQAYSAQLLAPFRALPHGEVPELPEGLRRRG